MFRNLISLFCLFLLFNSLNAEESPFGFLQELQTPSVELTEGLPNNIVNGTVSVISGEYIDHVVDFVLKGPMPLVFSRTYSSYIRNGSFQRGWNNNISRGVTTYKSKRDNSDSWALTLHQPHGSKFTFTHPVSNKTDKLLKVPFDLVVPKGLSKSLSELSAGSDIKNLKIKYNRKKNTVISKAGNGNKSTYKYDKRNHKVSIFRFDNEKNLRGQKLKLGSSEVWTKSEKTKKKYCHLTLKGDKNFRKNHVLYHTASDGRKIEYKFLEQKIKTKIEVGDQEFTDEYFHYYLNEVKKSHGPTEKYSYGLRTRGDFYLLMKKKLPEERFLATSYYTKGKNYLGEQIDSIKIDDLNDYRLDRVREQKAPVGIDSAPITTHRFIYNKGNSEVYDAVWHKTTYDFNDDQRIDRINHFKGHDKTNYGHYSSEAFKWGPKGSKSEGNLLLSILRDTNNRVHHANSYEYDDHGNIKGVTFVGKLTSSTAPQVMADNDFLVQNGYEEVKKSYSYSDDGLNLLISEKDTNENEIIYSYYPETDLISSKLMKYHHVILKREFFHYDDDAVMIKKIVDDGANESEDDLTGVTERQLTYVLPQKVIPIGLPEVIEEKYLDLATGKEQLLRKIICEYTKQGNLTSKTTFDADDQYAFTESWNYDAYGNIKKETNALGESLKRKYDENNNLIEQERLGSPCKIVNHYDYSNRLVKQEELHDSQLKYSTTHQYNYLSHKVSSVDAYGNQTSYTYDEFGRVTSTQLPPIIDEKGCIAHPIIKSEYDIAGFPTVITDPLGRTTTFEHNATGKPLHIVFPDGSEEWYTYRLDGQLISKISRDGIQTHFTLDSLGRIEKESLLDANRKPIKEIQKTYNTFHLISETDPEGLVIRYSYDGAGRLFQVFKNDTLFHQYSYDSLGRIHQVFDWYNENDYRVTTKTYDFLNRLKSESVSSADGILLHSEAYDYDYLGNQTKIQRGDQVTETIYNNQNNPVKIIDALGNVTHIEYNTSFRNTLNQYVLQTTTTDPLGSQTIHTYDAANQLVQTTKKNPLGVIIADQKKFYDLGGHCICIEEDVIYQGKVEKSIRTLYTYTTDDQIKSLTEAVGTKEQKITSYDYNNLGQKVAKIKSDGVLIHYAYDGLGRVSQMSSSDNTIGYTYEYNQRDQPKRVVDLISLSETLCEYNSFGQLQKEQLGNGLAFTCTCDYLDRMTAMNLPDGSRITYAYDAKNLKEIHRTMKEGQTYSHHNVEYTQTGQVAKSTLPGAAGHIAYQYDKLNRCVSIESDHFSHTVPQEGFNAVGNLLKCKVENQDYQFQYDPLYQLEKESGHVEHKYSHDSLHNRRLKDDDTHEINSLNQLTARGKEVYLYDKNGNLKQKSLDDKVTNYSYDALDRLVEVDLNGVKTFYTYDANGRRLSKKQAGQPDTLFFYQSEEEIGAWRDGAFAELKILNQSRRKSVAVELDQNVFVPTLDLFSNVVKLSDLEGNVVESYRYTSFGEIEIFDATGQRKNRSINPWQYSNKRYDEESGLVAFGLRYYDPDLGRWINPDPCGFEDGSNLYAYVQNNPLKFCDLLGLFTELPSFLNGPVHHIDNESRYLNYDTNMRLEQLKWSTSEYTFFPPTLEQPSGLHHTNDFINPKTNQRFNYPSNPLRGASFTNGINTPFEDFKGRMIGLSEMTGVNFSGVYRTSFGLMGDVINHFLQHRNMHAYNPVRFIQEDWRESFKNAPPGALFLQIGHSDGCTNIRNALIDFPEELRQRIVVLAVAPGSFIDKHLCLEVVHLCSHWDPIPKTDKAGMERCMDTIIFVDSPDRNLYEELGYAGRAVRGLRYHNFDNKIYEPHIKRISKNFFN